MAKKASTSTENRSDHKNNLAKNLEPTSTTGVSASKMGDMSLLLVRGTTIPCVLKTKIDSTYQGFATCQITKDVYSANGKTLLIERGSSVFGEQNVQLNQGQARVFVLWTRIDTPNGITININSPATGQLGEMGVGARVNNHFAQRFGSAIMLSFIQDAIKAGTTHLQKQEKQGDNSTNIENTSNTTSKLAEEALKNSINIPPTATINQGSLISITVARDVDFSDVYKLQRR
ncbi:trwE protein [Moraxella macacae 0408225]|uniref:TrwE protein n=1 Tax=Moraxella macacae 0408225 TaxID=1230338 RepID=L2F8N1_9GAMM|nr:type IV secretion system protein VirB10 [Moraxella macacae]ELA09260.1 trwE protein [Moraxella macacae 0408225]